MPRYEKRTSKRIDVIDVRLRDRTIQTRTGRAGALSKPKTTKHSSEPMAKSKFRVAIRAAKAKGFVHVSKLEVDAENSKLEAAISEHPEDDTARVVYGDWLQEQGDPRGELIAVQQRLRGASKASAPALRKRETALLAEHSSIWCGTLDEILHERSYADRAHVRVAWRLGFFDEVEVRLAEDPNDFVTYSIARPGEPMYTRASEILTMLRTLHSARFVTRVILGGFVANYVPAIHVLATGWPQTLRTFTITGSLGGESTPVPHRIGSLAAFCKAHPALEQLSLFLRDDTPGPLTLPKLEHLALWTNRMLSKRQLDDVLRAALPALRTFEFDVGAVAKLAPADLRPLFAAKLFPSLDTLRIGWIPDAEYATALAAVLRGSTLYKQLRRLVLTGPDWHDTQQELAPVMATALSGVSVSFDHREI